MSTAASSKLPPRRPLPAARTGGTSSTAAASASSSRSSPRGLLPSLRPAPTAASAASTVPSRPSQTGLPPLRPAPVAAASSRPAAASSASAAPISTQEFWTPSELANLKAFISAELAKIVELPSTITRLTTPEAMKIWSAAFTHASITGIPGSNYEGLETKGDALLALAFFTYVDEILPVQERTPSYYTELRRYWLSKPELAKFAEELGLPRFIKYAPGIMERPDINLKEDVFEAFFGAMFTVFDTMINPGTGYVYTYNYFYKFISNKNILLPEEQIFPSKTKLKELYDGLKWSDVRYISISDPNQPQITVAVLDNEGDRLATGTGRDRQAAENLAAANAIKVLDAQGINRESIAQAKPVDRVVEGLKERISRFLSTKGKYGPLELVRIYKSSGRAPIQIVELRTTQDYDTGRDLKVALSTGRDVNPRAARIAALENYIRIHRIA